MPPGSIQAAPLWCGIQFDSSCIFYRLGQSLPTTVEGIDPRNIPVIYGWRAMIKGSSKKKLEATFGVLSDPFGTTSNPSNKGISSGLFGISMVHGLVFYGHEFQKKSPKYKAFKPNEIIRMEFEVNIEQQCTLSFYNESKDNEFIWKLVLPKYFDGTKITKWYPIFSKMRNSCSIKVIRY